MIGGGGEKKTLRIVAEHAHIWHSFSDPETLAHKLEVLRGHCADVGRDPGEIEVSVGARGNPDEVGAALLAAGATMFTIGESGPDYDLTSAKRWIAWRDRVNAG